MEAENAEKAERGVQFQFLLDVPLILLAVLTVTSFLANWWWIFELTCHFRLQYALVLAVMGVTAYLCSCTVRSVLAWALVLLHVPWIAPFYLPGSPFASLQPDANTKIQCVSINVSDRNPDPRRVRTWVKKEDPDLLLLMEANLDWTRKQSGLYEQFSYRKTVSRSERNGMVLLSKKPIRNARILRPPDTTVSVLYTDIEFGDRNVRFTGVHTPSPLAPHLARARNKVLSGVADRVSQQSGPRILMGDLNTTSFSPYFRSFVRQTGLKDTRKGWGIQPTWPTHLWFRVLQICLDHCLVSTGFDVVNRGVGPSIGSDHLPVKASLILETDATSQRTDERTPDN